jgi:tRNA U34 5-carboxymethylaminomethyl modifying enzyme MnmG/GidA
MVHSPRAQADRVAYQYDMAVGESTPMLTIKQGLVESLLLDGGAVAVCGRLRARRLPLSTLNCTGTFLNGLLVWLTPGGRAGTCGG